MNRDAVQAVRVGAVRRVPDFEPLRLPLDVERFAAMHSRNMRFAAWCACAIALVLTACAIGMGY